VETPIPDDSLEIESLVETLRTQIVPVDPEDTMAEAGRKNLLADFIQMLERETGSRIGEDIENVHQMRVATRRMRSAFRLLSEHYKPGPTRPYIKGLRQIARRLGKIRDLDVMIDDLQQYQAKQPPEHAHVFDSIIERLDKRRRRARKKLNRFLDGPEYQSFIQQYAQFLTKPGKGARSQDADGVVPYQVRHVLPTLIHQHLAAVRAYDTVIDKQDQLTLHALRIEFKRLRYAITYFTDVLGSSAGEYISDIKKMQDHLGRLNDAYVAVNRLQALLDDDELTEEQTTLIRTYIEQLETEQRQRIADFPEAWQKFNTRSVQRKLATALLVLR
jgi:CHAD domain-containing protein